MKEHHDFDLYIGRSFEPRQLRAQDLEIFFVLDGKANIRIAAQERNLEKGDIMIANMGEEREITPKGQMIVCIVRFVQSFVWDYCQQKYPVFSVENMSYNSTRAKKMRDIFHMIIYTRLFEKRNTKGYLYSLLYRLLDTLIDEFSVQSAAKEEKHDDEKIEAIMVYIYDHYRDKISLEEISDELFLSKSTLSRLFKKKTGVYFADYVNQIRLDSVVSDLIYTDKGITTIAMDNGFSNTSSLNRIFKKIYDVTPTEFRSNERKKEKSSEEANRQEELRIKDEIVDKGFSAPKAYSASKVSITAGVEQATPFENKWGQCINMGAMSDLTLSNLQFHTEFLTENLGFTYVRLWNAFSEKMMITDGREGSRFNYTQVDLVLDFLVKRHIYPFFDFGNRPNTVISTPGKTIYFEEDNVQFDSVDAWKAMVYGFVRHIQRRYGREEISNWIFELSRDRTHDNTYFHVKDLTYEEAFGYLYRTVKSAAPQARVGGPSIIYGFVSDDEFVKEIQQLKSDGCTPDFYSVFEFPYIYDKDTFTYHRNPMRADSIAELVHCRQILDENGFSDVKLIVSEFNSSISNRNFLNDSCYRGVYFIRRIMKMSKYVEMICCWCGSDWIGAYFDAGRVANGDVGLLTKDTLKKPVYYAIYFLNQLGNELLYASDGCIITRKTEGEYVLLCYNYKQLSEEYYIIDEKQVSVEKVESLYANHDELELDITLTDIPESSSPEGYVIKKSRLNCDRGSILSEWARFGYEDDLKRQDIKYISDVSIPYQERAHILKETDGLHLQLNMKEQEMVLVQIIDEV